MKIPTSLPMLDPCRTAATWILLALLGTLFSGPIQAQTPDLVSAWEVIDGEGGLQLNLGTADEFGSSLCQIDDLDGDGIPELLVGAESQGPGGPGPGAVHALFLEPDGTVRSAQTITTGQGGFQSTLPAGATFGTAVALLSDFDGNGLRDVAVTSIRSPSSGGSLWILSLDATGSVVTQVEIGKDKGGFGGTIAGAEWFGSSVAVLGDLDGDGVDDLVCGAQQDPEGFIGAGAVWILFMKPDGTVKSEAKISATSSGFAGALSPGSLFGRSALGPGDIDGDGVPDLIVGATDAPQSLGRIFVLQLNTDGSVRTYREIGNGLGGFGGTLNPFDSFGSDLEPFPDTNGDGLDGLLVSSHGLGLAGGFWLLELQSDGTVASEQSFDESHPLLAGRLNAFDQFGSGLAYLSEAPIPFLVVGAMLADQDMMHVDQGELWFLQLCDSDPAPAFNATPTTGGTPLQVDFTNTSTGSGLASWSWDFGDGATSTLEHPSHVYTEPGTYTVFMTATGSNGSCTTIERDLVNVLIGAVVTSRNGSGTNPDVFDAQTLPVIGATWLTTADGTTVGASGLSFLVAYEDQLPGIGTTFGELLVDVSSPFLALDTSILIGGSASHDISIPNEVALAGATASTQVFLNNPGILTNALDLVFGY